MSQKDLAKKREHFRSGGNIFDWFKNKHILYLSYWKIVQQVLCCKISKWFLFLNWYFIFDLRTIGIATYQNQSWKMKHKILWDFHLITDDPVA